MLLESFNFCSDLADRYAFINLIKYFFLLGKIDLPPSDESSSEDDCENTNHDNEM